MVNVWIYHENGRGGVPKNVTTARAWYEKAALEGNKRGYTALAEMYEYGIGVTKDESIALALYRKAAAL